MLDRLTVVVASTLVCVALLAACGQTDEPATEPNGGGSVGPTPTIFPTISADPSATTGTPVVDDGLCASATPASANASAQWTISYALLETILASEEAAVAAFLTRTFVESGELTVFFAFLTPDNLGELEVINYFNQRSAEGLDVDDYGVISVPWAEIQEHGLPELQAGATVVTLTCSPNADQAQ